MGLFESPGTVDATTVLKMPPEVPLEVQWKQGPPAKRRKQAHVVTISLLVLTQAVGWTVVAQDWTSLRRVSGA